MKTAVSMVGIPMDAYGAVEDRALCPFCGGVVALRHRRVMGGQRVAYWRHLDNCNLSCPGRSGRVIGETGKKNAVSRKEIMTESNKTPAAGAKPAYVTALEKAYGEPSQAAFGSAVFYEKLKSDAYLEKEALAKYRFFLGETWDRLGGDEAWLGPWKKVYSRNNKTTPDDSPAGIVAELQSIQDRDTAISVPMILGAVNNAEAARKALAAAYDAPQVSDLTVYNIGDGGAMSGLVLAGRRKNGETTFLVFLMD